MHGFEPSRIASRCYESSQCKQIDKSWLQIYSLWQRFSALMNNKIGGDLNKIQTVGKYMVEGKCWNGFGKCRIRME